VLFAWELGDNFGHIARDYPVARRLRESGHTPVFASRNLVDAVKLLGPEGYQVLQAPRLLQSTAKDRPASYAEILLANGYHGDLLNKLVHAWRHVISGVDADVIVANHAPTAVLAARCMGLPTVATCIGFELPPDDPQTFRVWDPQDQARIFESEAHALNAINSVLASYRRTPITRLAELISTATVLMTTFAELDHYGPRDRFEYIGPVSDLPAAGQKPVPLEAYEIFGYLRESVPNLRPILDALEVLPEHSLCVIPGDKSNDGRGRLSITNVPQDIDVVMKSARLVVTYGTGTLHDALLAGRPLLLCPQNAEQYLAARRMIEMGAGLLLPPRLDSWSTKDVLRLLLDQPKFTDVAANFSAKRKNYSKDVAVNQVVNFILASL